MARIKTTRNNIGTTLAKAVRILENGGIIAFPTETFYGLGVKFDIEDSLKRLCKIKNRAGEKPFPLMIGDRSLLPLIAKDMDDKAALLMDRFWPGALTMLLPANSSISKYIVSGNKVAVRIPGESFALLLAKEARFPITATSANISGLPPPIDADTVEKYFGDRIDLIIDGGRTKGGLPSTIIDLCGQEIKIIREGAVRVTSS